MIKTGQQIIEEYYQQKLPPMDLAILIDTQMQEILAIMTPIAAILCTADIPPQAWVKFADMYNQLRRAYDKQRID